MNISNSKSEQENSRSGHAVTTATWLAAGSIAVLAAYFYVAERWTDHSLVTGLILATSAATFVLLTRRLLFSCLAVAALVAAIHVVSQAKQVATGIVLHSYDFVSILIDRNHAAAMWQWASSYRMTAAIAGAVAVVVGSIVYRLDGTRIWRPHAALAALTLGLATIAAIHMRSERRHTEFFYEDRYVSTFLASWADTTATIRQGTLLAAAGEPATKLAIPESCAPTRKPPHIILIHQESVAPPSLFPALDYDRRRDAMFRSFDGTSRHLRVETYGGASWLTEFSVMTGLSSFDFGGIRHMVQPLMKGRVRETLPQALGRCGYHRLMLYPMLRSYLSIDRFFTSVGIDEIIDARQQKAKRANERDHFYYANLLDAIERHTSSHSRPLFAFIETMATHGGYDYAYDEEVDVPGGGPGTPPEMHEYLRRLGMAHMDYDFLRSELARRFPGQPFLIIHYGDHHPTATRTLLGFPEHADVEHVMAGRNPLRLVTYFAVDGVAYDPPPLPSIEAIDVAFLGTILLDAARLPLSDTYRERRRLMMLCNGRYHDCPHRGQILQFHRRLIDSAIVSRL